MTTLNFADLQQVLPDESITWAGFGAPVLLNLSNATDNTELTPESLVLEAYGRLLDALLALETAINVERETPINVIEKTITAHNGNPVYQWVLKIEVEASTSLNNPIDPLAE